MKLIHNDCLEALKQLEDNSVDAVVTDPPYGLSFMGKKWDYDVPSVEIWQECLRVLKPGGYLLAFAGTRTQHRMAVRIEDAGFEIRDMIAWVYSTGFPKSLNIGKAVDKLRKGSEKLAEFSLFIKNRREEMKISQSEADKFICGGTTMYSFFEGRKDKPLYFPNNEHYKKMKDMFVLDNTWDDFVLKTNENIVGYEDGDFGFQKSGDRWDGKKKIVELSERALEWEGWGTALAPSLEPITVARKPLDKKTVAENCLTWGVGGINIDGSRIIPEYNLTGNDLVDIISICQLNHLLLPANNAVKKKFQEDMTSLIKSLFSVAENADMSILENLTGKMQENISNLDILCSEEISLENISINLNMFIYGNQEMEKYQKDLKYIISMALKMITDWKISSALTYQLIGHLLILVKKETNIPERQGRFPKNLIHDGSDEVVELFPNTKAGIAVRRNKGIVASKNVRFNADDPTNTEDVGYGDSGSAARFFYCAKASKSERNKGCEELEGKNNHSTVKPIALMEYLVKLVSREGATVLDPFMGSGSTGIACKKLNRDFIGIERDEDYIKIAEARINSVVKPLI